MENIFVHAVYLELTQLHMSVFLLYKCPTVLVYNVHAYSMTKHAIMHHFLA